MSQAVTQETAENVHNTEHGIPTREYGVKSVCYLLLHSRLTRKRCVRFAQIYGTAVSLRTSWLYAIRRDSPAVPHLDDGNEGRRHTSLK